MKSNVIFEPNVVLLRSTPFNAASVSLSRSLTELRPPLKSLNTPTESPRTPSRAALIPAIAFVTSPVSAAVRNATSIDFLNPLAFLSVSLISSPNCPKRSRYRSAADLSMNSVVVPAFLAANSSFANACAASVISFILAAAASALPFKNPMAVVMTVMAARIGPAGPPTDNATAIDVKAPAMPATFPAVVSDARFTPEKKPPATAPTPAIALCIPPSPVNDDTNDFAPSFTDWKATAAPDRRAPKALPRAGPILANGAVNPETNEPPAAAASRFSSGGIIVPSAVDRAALSLPTPADMAANGAVATAFNPGPVRIAL